MNESLIGVDKAAGILGLSPWTLRSWITKGKITSAKLGARRLIPQSELERLISESLVRRQEEKWTSR
jgi:excisionase family DNA binding protein